MENVTLVLLFFIVVYIGCHYYNATHYNQLEMSKDVASYHPSNHIETDEFVSTTPIRGVRESQLYITSPVF